MTLILPRSVWTSTPNARAGRPITSALTSITLHWPADGANMSNYTQEQVAEKLRRYRDLHVKGNGWIDIGYNFAVDQAGRIWDLTGLNQGAHAGTTTGNKTSAGVLLVYGTSESPSAAMIEGVKALRAWVMTQNAKATAVYGHRDWKSTACPGQPAYDLIKVGAFTAAPAPAVPPTRFSDVPRDHTFYDAIEWAAASGITSGYDDGTFRPGAHLVRADAAAMLFRLTRPIADVTADHPHALAIGWLQGSTTARGFGDGTFRPNASVARVDAAIFLHRLAGEPPVDIANGTFSDLGKLASPARTAATWLLQSGIAKGWPQPGGDVFFKPNESVSRGEFVTFLHRSKKG